jgi:hypothetical protein
MILLLFNINLALSEKAYSWEERIADTDQWGPMDWGIYEVWRVCEVR